jgi:hypothetical protein
MTIAFPPHYFFDGPSVMVRPYHLSPGTQSECLDPSRLFKSTLASNSMDAHEPDIAEEQGRSTMPTPISTATILTFDR